MSEQVSAITARHLSRPGCYRPPSDMARRGECGLVSDEGEQ